MYSPDWRETYQADKIILSTFAEFSEMLEEVKGAWKFYGSHFQNDWAAALEEYADIVHFMATVDLLSSKEGLTICDFVEREVYRWMQYYSSVESHAQLLCKLKKQLDHGGWLQVLIIGCNLFHLTPEQLLVAYLHKNKKNQARAQAGAISRDIGDIKASEQSTFNYMYQNGFISMTREEYNSKVDGNE
jgi:dimeric dUTPase (all-alpha-NTP-PPase superfamily)